MTQKFGVLDHLSLLEKKTLATPYHDLNDQALFSASWRKEALQVLLWALNVVDNLPDYSVLDRKSVV